MNFRLHQEENQRGSCLLLWTETDLENEPGGRSECAVGSREEESMGDGGGESKRGEGGRVGGDCDGERHCPKRTFLGNLSLKIHESTQFIM